MKNLFKNSAVQSNPNIESLMISWRRKATDIMLLVIAFMQLPGVIIFTAGLALPATFFLKLLLVIAYLIIVFCAIARKIDYRIRVWVIISGGYIVSLICTIAVPNGPYMRALPIFLAVAMLILVGFRSAWIATIISTLLIIVAPFLHKLIFIKLLVPDNNSSYNGSDNMLILQIIGMMSILISTMLLLWYFYNALMQTLTAQQKTTESLQDEIINRDAALQKLEQEIAERRRLEYELARISDNERQTMGQEIHDGVCQQLTAARLRSQVLERRIEYGEVLTIKEIQALSTLLEETINDAYNLAQGLYPLEPKPGALKHALKTLARRTKSITEINCQFVSTDNTDIHDHVYAQHLFRIAQEAVSNAIRHSGADQIDILLERDNDTMVLQIDDNGSGLNAEHINGMGMRTMTYRVKSMNGILTIKTQPSGGTTVFCRIPLIDTVLAAVTGKDVDNDDRK